MPKNLVLWNFAVRNTVYEKMAELKPDFMRSWAENGSRNGRNWKLSISLVQLFRDAQLAVQLAPHERRAAPSGQVELAKIADVVSEYLVSRVAVKPVEHKPVKRDQFTPGYHLTAIPKGELGELSKIAEELAEAQDAEAQGVKLMVLVELSDLVGAVEHYLDKHFPDLTFPDLHKMAAVTRRAFKNGRRA